jgi:hypothetical protein
MHRTASQAVKCVLNYAGLKDTYAYVTKPHNSTIFRTVPVSGVGPTEAEASSLGHVASFKGLFLFFSFKNHEKTRLRHCNAFR